MQFKDIVMQRYATKKFDGRKISDEKIGELLDLVRYAPSALNLQPWKIKIVTDEKIKAQLRLVANNQEQITSCSHLLVFCADPNYEGLIRRLAILFAKSGAPEEVSEDGYRYGPGFYPENVTRTAPCMVTGTNVSRARECAQWGESTGF